MTNQVSPAPSPRSLRLSLVRITCSLTVVMAMTMTTALAAPGAHGPNGEHLDAPNAAPSPSGLARLPDGSINVPKNAQRRMAVRTLLAPLTQAAATLELPGRITMDPNAGGRVQAVHGGRLEAGPQGLPVVGQRVNRGEVLAYVRHHADPYSLGLQQAQLAEVRAQRLMAQQRVQRLEGLEGTVPRKEMEAARTEAVSLVERDQSISQSLSVREALVAPVSGVVARTELVLGQVLEPRDVLLEVVDPARLMVEASTADAGLASRIAGAHLKEVAGAALQLKGASSVMRDGMLALTFAVRPSKPGVALPLAIGQPVAVLVQSKERVQGIVLPAQAVVRSPANESMVWIKSGAERFYPQPVQFRPLDAATVLVTQGLSADNRVVVQGAALMAQIR